MIMIIHLCILNELKKRSLFFDKSLQYIKGKQQINLRSYILMISLKDEIKKFEKMVYNKELAQFVTVDQMFVGGGITIQTMIHESNFVVEELKKISAVFINYCKLNEKVYAKIMEHELNLHSQQGKFNSLVSSVDRKLEESMKTIKQLHESTIVQNQKSTTIIHNVVQPIKQEIDKKVDKTTFESQMKKFLQEYDQGGLLDQDGEKKESIGANNPNDIVMEGGIPVVKKKGKVGYEDFYKLKAEIQNRLKINQTKLEQTSSEAIQGKGLIIKYIPIINKQYFQIETHTKQFNKVNNEILDMQNHLNTSLTKLNLQLQNRTNDQVWSSKLQSFQQKHLHPLFNELQNNFKMCQQQLKYGKQENDRNFKAVDYKIIVSANEIESLKINVRENQEQISRAHQIIQQNYDQFEMENRRVINDVQVLSQQTKLNIKELDKIFKNQTVQLKKAIQNLVYTIQESVMKVVNKRVENQLKLIENDIKGNRQKIKHLKSDVGIICQQIKNMKDILSRKANFTDFLQHVEKKADKQDFRQLKTRMHETSQQFFSGNLNQSINIVRPESGRKSSSLRKTSKTVVTPQSASFRLEKNDIEGGTKLFMCGLQGHLGQNKKYLSQNTRRCSIKSSTAIISQFAS